MNPQVLKEPGLYLLLIKVDQELALKVRKSGCPHCKAKLHDGGFFRKAWGCPESVLEAFSRRTSFDCSNRDCRHRTMPPSVRFLHRRVWIAAVLALVSPFGTARSSYLSEHLGVSERTVERWRQWWRTEFLKTPVWQSTSGEMLPSPAVRALPESLLDRIEASDPIQCLVRFLRLISALSVAPMRA